MTANLSFVFDNHVSKIVSRGLVNLGFCYVWAWVAKIYLPEADLCSDSSGFHAFIRLDGKFYDSNRPVLGTEDWRKLRTYKDLGDPKIKGVLYQQPRAFFRFWSLRGDFADKVARLHDQSRSKEFKSKLKKFTSSHVPVKDWRGRP